MQENMGMNFDEFLVVNTAEMEWLGSPSEGVLRKPLERGVYRVRTYHQSC